MTEQQMLNLVAGKTYAMTQYPGPAGPLRSPIFIESALRNDGGDTIIITFKALRFKIAGIQTLELRILKADARHFECVPLDDPDRTVVIATISDEWLWVHFGTEFLAGPPDPPPDGTDVTIPALVRHW